MISLVAALAGTALAVFGVAVLAARSSRAPRADLIAWTVALIGLALTMGALLVGFLAGFGPLAFRAMVIGSQVIAPFALCLGLAELAGRTGPVRFAARLLLSALAFIAFVILSTDTLTPLAFTKKWPDPTVYYETISIKLIEFVLAPVFALVAVIAILVAAIRAARDPGWRAAGVAVAAAGAAALALAVPGLIGLLGANSVIHVGFGGTKFTGLCLVAAALTVFAGIRASGLRPDLLDGRPAADYADEGWDQGYAWTARPGQAADLDPPGGHAAGRYQDDGRYRDDPADDRAPLAGYPMGGPELDGFDPDDPGSYYRAAPDVPYPASMGAAAGAMGASVWQPADRAEHREEPDRQMPPAGLPPSAGPPPSADHLDQAARERMFGQIAIYTLLEERVADFDKLTKRVVRQVQDREPDTLVYIVHAVPSAPLQRILYEVYRDRTAYEEHRQQPYITQFEIDRRPCVLATNVIELGLRQAKVSPFPSMSELLEQTGDNLPVYGSIGDGAAGHGPPDPGRGAAGYGPPDPGRGAVGPGPADREPGPWPR